MNTRVLLLSVENKRVPALPAPVTPAFFIVEICVPVPDTFTAGNARVPVEVLRSRQVTCLPFASPRAEPRSIAELRMKDQDPLRSPQARSLRGTPCRVPCGNSR